MRYDLETVVCCCCSSNDSEVYLHQAKELYNGLGVCFDVVRCRGCGFIYTNPRPTRETIDCFYPDTAGYYQPSLDILGGKVRLARGSHLRFSVLANYWGYDFKKLPKILDFLYYLMTRRKLRLSHIPRFVESGRLLDVGCAWGKYLVKMKQIGWDVYGLEVNGRAASYAREQLGLSNVRCGSFDHSEFSDGFFDVVHMGMVLEHLHDPREGLRRINRLLKDKGQLILSVPDISGFEARVFKDKSYTLQVPQHLSHFCPRTIISLLHQSGFAVETIIHQKSKKDLLKSVEYLENRWLSKALNNTLVKNMILSPLASVLSVLGKTSRMSVFAAKVSEEAR